MLYTIPHGNFYYLETLELSTPMLPDQELARAIKTAIKDSVPLP